MISHALISIAAAMVVLLVIAVAVTVILLHLAPKSEEPAKPEPEDSKDPKDGKKSESVTQDRLREHVMALVYIALALAILNWVLSESRWVWWQIGWEHKGVFWGTMVSIMLACFIPRFTREFAPVMFGIILAFVACASWAGLAGVRLSPDTAKAVVDRRGTKEFVVSKGGLTPPISPKWYMFDPVPGVVIVLDGQKRIEWKPGTSLMLPGYVQTIQIGSTKEPMRVIGYPADER